MRTILQHAWAEIEHDLGYKAPQGIPKSVRRRFSRLASLLETGDEEFKNIRDELETYAVNVKSEIPFSPSKVLIDRISLTAFIEQDAEVQKLEETLADYLQVKLTDVTNDYTDARVEELQCVDLQTIEQLKSALKQKTDTIVRVFKGRLKPKSRGSISRGISLYYLFQVSIAEGGDLSSTIKALNDRSIGHPNSRGELAKSLIKLVHNTG